jgi:predicted RNA-binding protein with PUA-like domain
VTLAKIKEDKTLAEIALIKQSRLSVMPLTEKEYERILKMGS